MFTNSSHTISIVQITLTAFYVDFVFAIFERLNNTLRKNSACVLAKRITEKADEIFSSALLL